MAMLAHINKLTVLYSLVVCIVDCSVQYLVQCTVYLILLMYQYATGTRYPYYVLPGYRYPVLYCNHRALQYWLILILVACSVWVPGSRSIMHHAFCLYACLA